MFDWLFGKRLEDVLSETKVVTVKGVRFEIKKLNAMDHIAGANVLRQYYDVKDPMATKPNADQDISTKKIRQHYSEALCAGIVRPKFSMNKEEAGSYWVEVLFQDWEMVEGLYAEILSFTYGKKKLTPSSLTENG